MTLGGDVILAINGEVVKDMHALISYLVEHTRPDDDIELNILRSNGERETISVTLGTRPEN